MVFSDECTSEDRLGQGIIVPCLNGAKSFADLVEEAKHLWRAEQSTDDAPDHPFGSSWGHVVLLENPNGQRIPEDWKERWRLEASTLQQEFGPLRHAADEEPIVGNDGTLNAAWMTAAKQSEALDSIDVLLATATNPEIVAGAYPSPETITSAWNRVNPKWCEYFWKNRAAGITTFQDGLIAERLDSRHRLEDSASD
jgi:hypothetical protein